MPFVISNLVLVDEFVVGTMTLMSKGIGNSWKMELFRA
jgi:hypothetical protein